MRITSETMVMRSLDRLQTRLQAYERAQSRLATGKQIMSPSDDPSGTRRGLTLRADLRAREQEVRNANDAIGQLDVADNQLQAAMNRLRRIQELATRGASETDVQERRALAAEVREITGELVGIANASHLDRPLFGGFTAGPAVEKVGGQWVSHGDGDQITRRVADTELVRVNTTAAEWLGFDPGNPGGDTLTMLENLADRLEFGTPAEVGAMLDDIGVASRRIGDSLSLIGASANRVESARNRAEGLLLTLRTELSNVEDVDVAQGVMELQIQQVGYEATLQALAKALPPSLVAFLR